MAKPRMTRRDKFAPRLCVRRYWIYKRDIHGYAIDLTGQPKKVIFHLPMPKSWSAKKKAQHVSQLHRDTPDIDNLLKGLMDAWMTNDCAVASIWPEKRWSDTPGISVEPIDADLC